MRQAASRMRVRRPSHLNTMPTEIDWYCNLSRGRANSLVSRSALGGASMVEPNPLREAPE